MKISIFTLHGAINVGAFLQAYSLQSVLQELYGEKNVSLVKYSTKSEKASKVQKIIKLLKQKRIGMMWFKYQTSKKYAQTRSLLRIDNEPFDCEKQYDMVVIGSDEVWNLESDTFIHHPQYFGKQIKANKIISYAASANNCKADSLRAVDMDFESFRWLSVRDENTYNLVQSISNKEPELVCDPTILIDSFEELIHPIAEKNYILVYSYGLSKAQIKEVKSYARNTRKKLISVGTYNAWCDKNMAVTPIEFLSWLAGADAVVTSTFHGTVLSTRLHKNVAVYAQKSHKIKYFLKQFDMEERNVMEGNDLKNILDIEINYEIVEQKMKEIRKKSISYLKKALEED